MCSGTCCVTRRHDYILHQWCMGWQGGPTCLWRRVKQQCCEGCIDGRRANEDKWVSMECGRCFRVISRGSSWATDALVTREMREESWALLEHFKIEVCVSRCVSIRFATYVQSCCCGIIRASLILSHTHTHTVCLMVTQCKFCLNLPIGVTLGPGYTLLDYPNRTWHFPQKGTKIFV